MAGESASVCVFEPFTPQEVVMVESILSGSGIPYHIENEANARGSFGLADGQTRVFVPRSRSTDAATLLAGLRERRD